MLLGLGEDAHVASIFPGSELLEGWPPVKGRATELDADVGQGSTPRRDRVAAVWAAHLDAWRITLIPVAVLDARSIVMVVAGASKAHAVRAALELPLDVGRFPAQILREAGGRVEWFVDRAAAPADLSS
jgi:6-phosphogluconolactonase